MSTSKQIKSVVWNNLIDSRLMRQSCKKYNRICITKKDFTETEGHAVQGVDPTTPHREEVLDYEKYLYPNSII